MVGDARQVVFAPVLFLAARRCLFFVGSLVGSLFCFWEQKKRRRHRRSVDRPRRPASVLGALSFFFFAQASRANAVAFLKSAGTKENSYPPPLKEKIQWKHKRKNVWRGRPNTRAHMPACIGRIPRPFFCLKAIGRTPMPHDSACRHYAGAEARLTHKRRERLGSCSSILHSFFLKQEKDGWMETLPAEVVSSILCAIVDDRDFLARLFFGLIARADILGRQRRRYRSAAIAACRLSTDVLGHFRRACAQNSL